MTDAADSQSGEPASKPGKPASLPAARSLSAAGGAIHAEDVATLLARLQVNSSDGLSVAEAGRRAERYGPNRLPQPPKDPAWRRLLAQFADPLVLTLLAAAIVAAVVGATAGHGEGSFFSRYADALAILLIVVLNAVIGFYQEHRAEAALEALQSLASPHARVRRGGALLELEAAELVPGDLLELEAGDAVPADARLVQTIDFASEESALTGESVPSGKDAMAHVDQDAPLGDRETMVYTGTMVVRGKGRAVVTSTGGHTELGRIGAMLSQIGVQKTPLEERLDAFGKVILVVCLGLSVTLMVWGFARPLFFGGEPRVWHVLLLEAVALAVAAIPEGLPAITTITLALGMQRMARRGAIVRKLPAVETLGAATIICSDKTGTLTQNAMNVRELHTADARYRVSGEGYEPVGAFHEVDGAEIDSASTPETLRDLLATAALCNNAHLAQDEETGRWTVIGDPTEGALLAMASKAGYGEDTVQSSNTLLSELPFDSDRKRMTVVTRDARGNIVAHVKGSADALLPRCISVQTEAGSKPLDEAQRLTILETAEEMSGRALRVLAFCRREEVDTDGDAETIETELTFLGLVGMLDPPRPGVDEAVRSCAHAGIRAVMITGDHKLTASAIAQEVGMWSEGDRAITGAELAALSDDELAEQIMRLRVFARTTPEQKLRIVRAFKQAGHVVAMTGDGVNDAPALRESSIGVAMGKTGTDVARQAADLILADDNFATIVDAVREGRAIYRNIQKFIFFLLSANMGLVVAVFVVSFFATWPPLTPLMVLWINLVTNGLPALALGVDPPDDQLMEEPPRPVNESLMVFRDYLGIAYVGGIIGAAAVALYVMSASDPASLLRTRALAFSVLALAPLMHAVSCRSPISSAFAAKPLVSVPLILAIFTSAAVHLVAVLVPALQPVFKTFPISFDEWLWVLALSALVLPAVEVAKFVNRKRLQVLEEAAPASRM